MSKRQIDAMIPKACIAIKECGLSIDGKVDKTLRGQIASFGAAVTMGTLISAVAFFSRKGSSDSERQLLMKAIYRIVFPAEAIETISETSLLDFLLKKGHPNEYKERVIDAAIAIKLAMNHFDLQKGKNKQKVSEAEGS